MNDMKSKEIEELNIEVKEMIGNIKEDEAQKNILNNCEDEATKISFYYRKRMKEIEEKYK